LTDTVIYRLALVLVGIFFVATAGAQDYEIRLHRAIATGAKYRITGSGQQFERMQIFAGGKQVDQKEEDIRFDIETVATALTVDALGRPTQYTLAIEKFVVSPAGGDTVTLERGTVISGRLEGQRVILAIGDAPLGGLAAKVIEWMFPVPTSSGTDDDVFGTRERKKVGDRWPIDARAAAHHLGASLKAEIDSNLIKGETALVRAGRTAVGDVITIAGTFSLDGFSMPLPDGVKIVKGRTMASYEGQLPVDARRPPLRTTMKMMNDVVAVRPADDQSPEITVRTAAEQYISRAFEPIP